MEQKIFRIWEVLEKIHKDNSLVFRSLIENESNINKQIEVRHDGLGIVEEFVNSNIPVDQILIDDEILNMEFVFNRREEF